MHKDREADRLIGQPELLRLVPYSSVQIWRMEQDGRFPRRVKLGPSKVAWSMAEIEDWIASRMSERDAEQPDPGEID